MRKVTGWMAGIVSACAAVAAVAASMPNAAAPAPVAPAGLPAAMDDFSVLTYNIEGLPAPIAWGRSGAAGRIGDRLAELRRDNLQPHVVVLQEAFGAAQRAIGARAGYKYIAFGPDRDFAPATLAMTDGDRAFSRQARFLRGETEGKWQGSGLAILSDYPIVAVRRMAFPAWACAGYDCLANKGVLMALVAVPGVEKPVAVVATHMNSKNASGVSKARWNYAFGRQVDAISGFLHDNLPADTPYVFAGDTNIGRSEPRRAEFEAMLTGLPRDAAPVVHTALGTCLGDHGGCAMAALTEARKAYAHGKDWQVYGDGADVGLKPVGIAVPFGHDAAGKMLSDHIGYTAFYQFAALERRQPSAAVQVASLR